MSVLLMPAIDLRDGRCVRLYQGDFAAETRYPQEPRELVRRYRDLGAQWIHIVDLDGARDGTMANAAIITALAAEPGVRLQVGGGVRSAATIEQLLQLGVARIVIGSAAIDQRDDALAWLQHFGPQRLCFAFDVRIDSGGKPCVRTRGWRHDSAISLWEALACFDPAGLQHVLCTDIERDGTMLGPNLELYTQAIGRYPALCWQASGGVRTADDLRALAALGVATAVSGKALLEGNISPRESEPFLRNASSPASTSATVRS